MKSDNSTWGGILAVSHHKETVSFAHEEIVPGARAISFFLFCQRSRLNRQLIQFLAMPPHQNAGCKLPDLKLAKQKAARMEIRDTETGLNQARTLTRFWHSASRVENDGRARPSAHADRQLGKDAQARQSAHIDAYAT